VSENRVQQDPLDRVAETPAKLGQLARQEPQVRPELERLVPPVKRERLALRAQPGPRVKLDSPEPADRPERQEPLEPQVRPELEKLVPPELLDPLVRQDLLVRVARQEPLEQQVLLAQQAPPAKRDLLARVVRQAKLEKLEARALLARLELQVQEKQERLEHRGAREKLVLLVPPALQERLEQQERLAVLVRVGLLAKLALRAHRETPEAPGKQVLLADLALVEKLVRRAVLDPQVPVERQELLVPLERREPRGLPELPD
jgi:hypothetical protein